MDPGRSGSGSRTLPLRIRILQIIPDLTRSRSDKLILKVETRYELPAVNNAHKQMILFPTPKYQLFGCLNLFQEGRTCQFFAQIFAFQQFFRKSAMPKPVLKIHISLNPDQDPNPDLGFHLIAVQDSGS